MSTTDPLLQPFTLRHLRLRNRFMSTAHEPAFCEDGMPKARYRLYQAEKARGGIALTMFAGSAVVSPDSAPPFGNVILYRDEVVPWIRELTDAVHEHGAAIMIQMTHLGRRTRFDKADWLPPVAASPVRERAHRSMPKAAEDWDIARITRDFADAAERCRAGAVDGVEIECSGHLMTQFWSRATNLRTDAYGGPLFNRLRFTMEVLAAIRDRVGPDFIIGVRMTADAGFGGGVSAQEGSEIARHLRDSGLIDYINVLRGRLDSDVELARMIPGMGSPAMPHLDLAGEIRRTVAMPVFHAGRIQDVASARHAVASGKVDMVGMTRAHIADPHIARKVAAGRENEIRPCVGMGYCIDRIYFGADALCIHNAATGREDRIPHEIARGPGPARKVVVVGAGPSGLEAARVAAARGHAVTVFEAADRAGGQVLLAAAAARRREIKGIVDWRLAQCAAHDVRFCYNSLVEADEVMAEDPDIVLVATGGTPHAAFLEAGEDLATSSWDVLSGQCRPPDSAILYDDAGGHAAMTAAEYLLEAGTALEIVTPDRTLAPELGGTNYPAYFAAMARHHAGVTLNLRLSAIHRAGNGLRAVFVNDYDGSQVVRDTPMVVVEAGTLPNDRLYFDLRPHSTNLGEVDYPAMIEGRPQALRRNPQGRFALWRIGDAVAARNIHAAVYDAIRLTMTL